MTKPTLSTFILAIGAHEITQKMKKCVFVKLFEDYCAVFKCEKYSKSKALSSYVS